MPAGKYPTMAKSLEKFDGDGDELTEESLEKDAKLWSGTYTKYIRGQFGQNPNHGFTKTCTKYATDEKAIGSDKSRLRVAICQFFSVTIVVLTMLDALVEKSKKYYSEKQRACEQNVRRKLQCAQRVRQGCLKENV